MQKPLVLSNDLVPHHRLAKDSGKWRLWCLPNMVMIYLYLLTSLSQYEGYHQRWLPWHLSQVPENRSTKWLSVSLFIIDMDLREKAVYKLVKIYNCMRINLLHLTLAFWLYNIQHIPKYGVHALIFSLSGHNLFAFLDFQGYVTDEEVQNREKEFRRLLGQDPKLMIKDDAQLEISQVKVFHLLELKFLTFLFFVHNS